MRAFIIGATGYLGGHIAANFRDAGHEVTGFSRNEAGDEKLRTLGVGVFRGDIKDREGLVAEARKADCIVLAARVIQSSWDEELEIVGGLLDGVEGMGKTVLHTSGTGVLGQQTRGDYGDGVFSESDPIVTNPIMVPRVKTENLVRDAAGRGIRGIVIRPPGIWGAGTLPAHARLMMKTVHAVGEVWYVGRGLNAYTNVHVEDLAEVYRLAWEKGIAGALYHATSGELPNKWMAEIIGRALDLPIRSVTVEQGAKYWGEYSALIVMGSSSRSTSPRARRDLGWVPKRFDIEAELTELARAAHADASIVARQTRPAETSVTA